MNGKKYLNYVIFLGIVAIVVGLAVSHSHHMRALIDAMAGPDRAARVAAAKELVQGEQFTDTVTGEPVETRVKVVQALEDWARDPMPPKPAAPAPAAGATAAEAPKVWGPNDATRTLVGNLKDQDKPVRDRTALALLRVATANPDNLQEVVNGIKDGDANVKKTCVRVLQFVGQTSPEAAAAWLTPEVAQLVSPGVPGQGAAGDQVTPQDLDAAKQLWGDRNAAVAAKIIDTVVAFMKKEGDARGPGGDVLGSYKDQREQSVAALLPFLKDSDAGVRAGMASALGKVGSKTAVPALKEAAKDATPVRRAAIGALALIADPSGEDVLIASVGDPNDDNEARADAATGLGRIATPEAVSALIKALSDYDLKIENAAVSALARAGKPAIPALTAALHVADPNVRMQAAEALGGIAQPEANAGLVGALKDGDAGVRRQAAASLGFPGNSGAVGPLVAMLADPDGGEAAESALVRIGEPARAALASALSSPNEIVAYRAADALGRQGDATVPAIKAAARTPASQRWALVALGAMGATPPVTDALQELAKSPDQKVRDDAADTLKRLAM